MVCDSALHVMPREGHGSRNVDGATERNSVGVSCPARGMGVEINSPLFFKYKIVVMPREGHGSRNCKILFHGIFLWE